MLLLIDLDNTLIDRRAAYKSWADSRFGAAHTPWLIDADRDGYEPREALAERISTRFGLPASEVLAELRHGMVDHLEPDPHVQAALAAATAAGLVPVVVTNGTVAQQEAKLRRTGLDRLLAGWTISEGVGARKPSRRIFELAAASVGRSLTDGGWMVGDHAAYDIAGGEAAGLHTAWVSHGQPWPAAATGRPTVIAFDCPAALNTITARRHG